MRSLIAFVSKYGRQVIYEVYANKISGRIYTRNQTVVASGEMRLRCR